MKAVSTKALVTITLTLLLGSASVTCGAEYLSSSDITKVGVGSFGVSIVGMFAKKVPAGRKPLITGHLPLEEKFQRWLGGQPQLDKSNILDTELGAFATPFLSGALLTAVNARYPRGDRSNDMAQDLFLFTTGALATKGITDIAKGIFARERPFQHILGDSLDTKSRFGNSYIHHSFFSGHTSGAFFAVSFLNLRVREIMRQRMTGSEYRSWRWASSGLLFGWASYVGLSRVHAYKHHLSDVMVGAAAGMLVSELFYNFGKKTDATHPDKTPMLFRLTMPI